jgi:hypothetical protein
MAGKGMKFEKKPKMWYNRLTMELTKENEMR